MTSGRLHASPRQSTSRLCTTASAQDHARRSIPGDRKGRAEERVSARKRAANPQNSLVDREDNVLDASLECERKHKSVSHMHAHRRRNSRSHLDEVLDEVEDDGLVREGDEGLGVGEGEGTETGTEAARVRSGFSLHAFRDAVQGPRGYGNTRRARQRRTRRRG